MKKLNSNKITYLRYGELYCGPGGLALGAVTAELINGNKNYKIKHSWASDYDLDSCKTYSINISPNNPNSVFCCDVKNLNLERLTPIDIFAYGFPCNDFSVVGEQRGFHGKFGALYSYGVKILNLFKPKFFVAENVSGLVSANKGAAFKMILNELRLAGNGYNITAHLYKAEEYGIPQTRHRIIIVGIDKNLGLKFKIPAPTKSKENFVTVREALSNIPENAFNNEINNTSKTVVERLKHIKPGENAWTANIPNHLKLNVKSARMSQIYKRLHPDKPSYTVTGSGGGGTHVYHWRENRSLTNRERARLQSFPDSYRFIGSYNSVRKQIGMAVPPKLANVIFTSLLKTYASFSYDHIASNIEIPLENNINLLNYDYSRGNKYYI